MQLTSSERNLKSMKRKGDISMQYLKPYEDKFQFSITTSEIWKQKLTEKSNIRGEHIS